MHSHFSVRNIMLAKVSQTRAGFLGFDLNYDSSEYLSYFQDFPIIIKSIANILSQDKTNFAKTRIKTNYNRKKKQQTKRI